MRVLFWGTPEFAAPALRALLGEGCDVVAVVTQPDKPQGRHRSATVAPPVKQVALEEDFLRLPALVEEAYALRAALTAAEPDSQEPPQQQRLL